MRNETRPIYRLPPEILAAVIEFYQSEEIVDYHQKAYDWVRFMLVSRTWRATILSFPSLWSRLVASGSISQSDMLTIVERSGSHLLRVSIPHPAPWTSERRSVRYKHVDLVAGLLPRTSQLAITTPGHYDTLRIYHAFKNCPANQLRRLSITVGSRFKLLDELFVLDSPRLTSLHLASVKSWPAHIAGNLTHIRLDYTLNAETLERDLKHSPRLKQIKIYRVHDLEQFRNRPKISLNPGTQLIIMDSHSTVASIFGFGSTNHLSITKTVPAKELSITSFLELTLPRNIWYFRNLDGITEVHLEIIDTGRYTHTCGYRIIAMVLRCFTEDRETLHINLNYSLSSLRSPYTIPERPPAMNVLDCLRPLDLGKVVELRMKGFVGEWGLHYFELFDFLQRMQGLRHIKTGDNNRKIFWSVLDIMERITSVVVGV